MVTGLYSDFPPLSALHWRPSWLWRCFQHFGSRKHVDCTSAALLHMYSASATRGSYNSYSEDMSLDLVFFSAFEDLRLQNSGTMESNGIRKLYEPSPVPTLYVGWVRDLLGRVPLFPCFLDGNTTATIPYKYAARQKQAFKFGCADGQAGPGSRRGSHVYEVNTWLWNFGRPQPRVHLGVRPKKISSLILRYPKIS